MKSSVRLKYSRTLSRLIDKPLELSLAIKIAFNVDDSTESVEKSFINPDEEILNNLVIWGIVNDEDGLLSISDKKLIDITHTRRDEKVVGLSLKSLTDVIDKEVPKDDLIYYHIAVSFQDMFLNNLKSIGARTVNVVNARYGKWVTPIRLMMSNDGVTIEELREVWKFLDKHNFWVDKVQSTDKLRTKFQTIHSQIKGNGRRKETGDGSKGSGGVSSEYVQSIFNDLQSD